MRAADVDALKLGVLALPHRAPAGVGAVSWKQIVGVFNISLETVLFSLGCTWPKLNLFSAKWQKKNPSLLVIAVSILRFIILQNNTLNSEWFPVWPPWSQQAPGLLWVARSQKLAGEAEHASRRSHNSWERAHVKSLCFYYGHRSASCSNAFMDIFLQGQRWWQFLLANWVIWTVVQDALTLLTDCAIL